MIEGNNKWTSFDLMRVFNINKGSWQYLKKKYNLDDYATSIVENGTQKWVYEETAYNILEEHQHNKDKNTAEKTDQALTLRLENEQLRKSVANFGVVIESLNKDKENLQNERDRLQERVTGLLDDGVNKDKKIHQISTLSIFEFLKYRKEYKNKNKII